jgi:hypothetical protein
MSSLSQIAFLPTKNGMNIIHDWWGRIASFDPETPSSLAGEGRGEGEQKWKALMS